jgi:hypothetical protein
LQAKSLSIKTLQRWNCAVATSAFVIERKGLEHHHADAAVASS